MLPIALVRSLSRFGLGKQGDAPIPDALRPMVATLGRQAFNDPDWVYEPGWDGRRVLAEVRDGHVRLWDRDRREVTASFRQIARACRECPTSLVVDGEVVALDARGMPVADAPHAALVYMMFDCLHVHGHTLLGRPLEFRRDALRALKLAFGATDVRITDLLEGVDGRALFRQSVRIGLAGVVAKRRGSAYVPGVRSPDWVKIPAHPHEELVVGGFLEGARRGIGRLLLGRFDPERRLAFVGLAEIGPDALRREVAKMVPTLARKTCPFVPRPNPSDLGVDRPDAAPHWVKPVIVAEVDYGARAAGVAGRATVVDVRLDGA